MKRRIVAGLLLCSSLAVCQESTQQAVLPDEPRQVHNWLDSNRLYRTSQGFVISAGAWDAIETGRGVPYFGEGGWTHVIAGNSTGGAVGLNLALDAATLFAAHKLAKHGHRRLAVALNVTKGAFSVAGATTWLGSCYGKLVAAPSNTHATYVCK